MKCLRESQNGFFVPLLNTEESMTDDERIFEIAQKTALINPQSESMVEGSSNTEMNQSIEKPEPGLKLDSSLNKLSLSRNSFVTDKKTPCLLQFNSIVVDCNDFDYDRPNLPNEQKYDCSWPRWGAISWRQWTMPQIYGAGRPFGGPWRQ